LIVTFMIGGTLSYLHDKAEPLTNHLTFINNSNDNRIKAVLEEVWNPEDGLNLIPGAIVEKKPSIKNISTADISEWAGIQIIFEKLADDGITATVMTPAEVEKLLLIMDINYNSEEWTKESNVNGDTNAIRYFYNEIIAPNESTLDLFSEVKIKDTTTNEQIDMVAEFAPGGINIRIEGAVVQGELLTQTEAKEELIALLPID